MTSEEGVVKTKRIRDLGRELQQIALDLANEGEDVASKLALRAALKAVSYVPPKGADGAR